MPNGVICGGAGDGSNQLGEIVTCHAITALPLGCGWSASGCTEPRTSAASTSTADNSRRRMTELMSPPFEVYCLMLIARCLLRRQRRRRRGVEVAGDETVMRRRQRRYGRAALRHRLRAARVKAAARRRVERAR